MQREVKLIGIDLAKTSFWVRAEDVFGKRVMDKKVSREKLYETVVQLRPQSVAMEACGGAHYWGRLFEKAGILVKLIPPQHVRPFRRNDKNDRNDSLAICEASRRPELKFVRVKSEEHQDLQMLLRVRESLIQRRTQVLNEMRAYILEHGFSLGLSKIKLMDGARKLLSEDKLNRYMAGYVQRTLESLSLLNEEIKHYDDKIKHLSKTDSFCKTLLTQPGIGPVSAIAIRSVLTHPSDFKNGRQFSAFLGLVPKQNSSGGKTKLLGIAKDGNRYLRQLLIHGARSVLIKAVNKTDALSLWITQKIKDRGFNKACVALANKNARQVWAVMHKTAQKNLVT